MMVGNEYSIECVGLGGVPAPALVAMPAVLYDPGPGPSAVPDSAGLGRAETRSAGNAGNYPL